MIWLAFLIIALITTLILVPLKHWKRLWPAGIMGVLILYTVDSTLIGLGAFAYEYERLGVSGIPILYLISGFGGALILAYHYPSVKRWKFPYILLAAAIFLGMELTMWALGYFFYLQWNPVKSFFLNIFGFTTTLWLDQWIGAIGKGENRLP